MGRSRYQKPQNNRDEFNYAPTELPIEKTVAVYYRQSTLEQVGNISTSMQTIDMVEHLIARGWDKDHIILIDMDEGVSGTKGINERDGMRTVYDLILNGEIGAVATQDEDRLFRDVTQIQVNIFIDACKTSNVMVITPNIVYDFAHPQQGNYHMRMFRQRCEMAADYIQSVVVGKMHRAKKRLALNGQWFGGRTPPGFMIDLRKTLPDGTVNSHYRKYVPFESYAEVVIEYFKMFVKNGGNLHGTIRQIHEDGPYYPDPNTTIPPSGFRAIYPMQRYENGYCPGETALIYLLTNAVYLGHWAYKGVIQIYDNHPAIVPKDLFFKAFNYR